MGRLDTNLQLGNVKMSFQNVLNTFAHGDDTDHFSNYSKSVLPPGAVRVSFPGAPIFSYHHHPVEGVPMHVQHPAAIFDYNYFKTHPEAHNGLGLELVNGGDDEENLAVLNGNGNVHGVTRNGVPPHDVREHVGLPRAADRNENECLSHLLSNGSGAKDAVAEETTSGKKKKRKRSLSKGENIRALPKNGTVTYNSLPSASDILMKSFNHKGTPQTDPLVVDILAGCDRPAGWRRRMMNYKRTGEYIDAPKPQFQQHESFDFYSECLLVAHYKVPGLRKAFHHAWGVSGKQSRRKVRAGFAASGFEKKASRRNNGSSGRASSSSIKEVANHNHDDGKFVYVPNHNEDKFVPV